MRRLDRVADDEHLEVTDGREARRLALVGADLPSSLGRLGVVRIAWWVDEGPPWEADWPTESGYGLSWDGESADPDLPESGPTMTGLAEALAWATRRSDAVIVRPARDPGTHYWAGAGAPPSDPQGRPLPVLPPLPEAPPPICAEINPCDAGRLARAPAALVGYGRLGVPRHS